MIIVSIDGASRRPGNPDCSTIGVSMARTEDRYIHNQCYETFSTSQRGELNGLIAALQLILTAPVVDDFYLITDSEYIFNSVSKEWYKGWQRKGWTTADGSDLKHKDAWIAVCGLMDEIDNRSIEITPYHIKGHVVSVGKATAKKLIEADETLKQLHEFVEDKYLKDIVRKPDVYLNAVEVFERNHGFLPPPDVLKEMIILNTITDTFAGYLIDKADSLRLNQ